MAARHLLNKVAQSRANHHHHVGPITKHRWMYYMLKHWSLYTLIFSSTSLLLYCSLFYDMQSSPTLLPTSLLLHPGRQMGALKAQMGDSNLFSLTIRSSPSEIIVGINSVSDTSSNKEESISVKPLKEVVSKSEQSTKEETRKGDVAGEEMEASNRESSSEENTRDIDIADEKKVKEMIAAAGTLAKELPSSKALVTDGSCDWSKGKWVYDENYPIYKPNTCALLDEVFKCVENGRPNSEFQKYRWQPTGCDLPRFDARDMLERLRGSRMAFVGDSIGRNNWESMLCLLSQAVSNKSRVYEINGEPITKHSGFLIYRFEDYNCTVEYYRSPHLVPQGSGPPGLQDPRLRSTLKLDIVDWSSSQWKTADIVILNAVHWWTFEKTIRSGCFFQEGQTVHFNMTVHEGFKRAMQTVARFVERDMDPKISQVIFRSYAPVHFKGGTWDQRGFCDDSTKPLQKFRFIWEDRTPCGMISEVMATIVKNPVNFLNITYLSDLRPDGHPLVWQTVPNSPRDHQDCSHWCLPGVPDTWNEILLATLLKNGKGKWGIQKIEVQ